MSKRDYLNQLLRQHPDWIRGSMADPSPGMIQLHVALHAIALRRMTNRRAAV